MDTNFLQIRMKRLFTEGFTVLDIAENLISFDADKKATEVRKFMSEKNLEIVGVRKKELESLRNNLAHAQDILTYDWTAIVKISGRLDKIMTRI